MHTVQLCIHCRERPAGFWVSSKGGKTVRRPWCLSCCDGLDQSRCDLVPFDSMFMAQILADLARGMAADQSAQTKDLLDRVVQQLFRIGLSLQATADLPGEVARQRLSEAMDRLDQVINEIRDHAFTSGDG